MVKNLAELKRALAAGVPFEVVEHFIHPDYTGQKRVVQKMQTNGMYTGIYGDPDAPLSKVNYGKGSWIDFGKASDWTFCNGLCQQHPNGRPIWSIRLLEQEANRA